MEILNYDDFMDLDPHLIGERRGIKFYDDLMFGDGTTCIAVIDNVAFDCGFFEPWLCTGEIGIVWERYEQIIADTSSGTEQAQITFLKDQVARLKEQVAQLKGGATS
jgi:hypothetical protein